MLTDARSELRREFVVAVASEEVVSDEDQAARELALAAEYNDWAVYFDE